MAGDKFLFDNVHVDVKTLKSSGEKQGNCFGGEISYNIRLVPDGLDNASNDVCGIEIDVKCGDGATVVGNKSVCVGLPLSENFENILSRRMNSYSWTQPEFDDDFSKIKYGIQDMLVKYGNCYVAVTAICNSSFSVCMGSSDEKNVLNFYLSKHYEGADELKGVFAVISKAYDPYEAIRKAYGFAYEKGYIKTTFRSQKELPKIYQKLGWCTWDAFYKNVSAEGIFEKLKEFKEKNVPVKWVVIDDGWSQLSGENLTELKSFCEDKTKFPDGLKKCIEKMKKAYGIEQVGIWHSFIGCWNGINHESELYKELKDYLAPANDGCYIPKADKYFEFFDKWYSYLKSCGVDFVKIDTQGVACKKMEGIADFSDKYIKMHLGMEKAAKKHFDANVINCMGMSNMDMHFRSYSPLARNSDDFYPNKENGFAVHLVNNAYNAVFQRELFFCDFDMWWTKHVSSKQNSVLRAISGGPVYISDKVGETERKYIEPIIDESGNVIKCDNIAVPADDCLFKNCRDGVLKIYNTVGDEGVVAAFNLSNECKSVEISKDDFNGNGNFEAYAYFEKKWYGSTAKIELEPNDVEIVNFYKADGGKVTAGNTEKYISVATDRQNI